MAHHFFIAPIVEGHGEVQAVPLLLRRIAADTNPKIQLQINPALRVKAGSFQSDQTYFRRYIELAARKANAWPNRCVLILLDSEDGCPGEIGPQLLQRASECRSDTHFLVIIARREYETWFIAAAKSLRGVCGLPAQLETPPDPEGIRGAKEWLSKQMPTPYNEPEHQPKMTATFDFTQASRIRSFERFFSKLQALFTSSSLQ